MINFLIKKNNQARDHLKVKSIELKSTVPLRQKCGEGTKYHHDHLAVVESKITNLKYYVVRGSLLKVLFTFLPETAVHFVCK